MSTSRGCLAWVLAFTCLALGVAAGIYVPRLLYGPATNKPQPDVITEVRELSRLEGVTYHIERVVDLKDKQQSLFGLITVEDAVLLVASGDVVAGVDLAGLRPEDVVIAPDRRSVTLRLPPAQVFSARLDSEHTYVHTRTTDLLATRKESLESEARQAAERTLRSAAEEAGIVKRAQDSVGRTVRSLVRSLGYETVNIDFRDRA